MSTDADASAPKRLDSRLSAPMWAKRGRPFPTHTPLGKVMAYRGYTVAEVSAMSRVHHRTMTEYLAGRVPIKADHRMRLAHALKVNPDDLVRRAENTLIDPPVHFED